MKSGTDIYSYSAKKHANVCVICLTMPYYTKNSKKQH